MKAKNWDWNNNTSLFVLHYRMLLEDLKKTEKEHGKLFVIKYHNKFFLKKKLREDFPK